MKAKLKAALKAVEDLFSDTSVTPQATLKALEELQTDIEIKMEGLKADIKRSMR